MATILHAKIRSGSYQCVRLFRSVTANRVAEPGARIGPVALRGDDGDAKHVRRLFESEAREVAQLHQFGFACIVTRKLLERLVDREQFVVILKWRGDFQLRKVAMLRAGSVLGSDLPARALDEDAAHRFRRSREKV